MKIEWQESMRIDNGAIDDDHRYIFKIVNRFTDARIACADRRHLASIMNELSSYVALHFAREEAFQRQIGFPLIDEHRAEHRALAVRLRELTDLLATGRNSVVFELSRLLSTWLLEHTLHSDLLMRRYTPARLPRILVRSEADAHPRG